MFSIAVKVCNFRNFWFCWQDYKWTHFHYQDALQSIMQILSVLIFLFGRGAFGKVCLIQLELQTMLLILGENNKRNWVI